MAEKRPAVSGLLAVLLQVLLAERLCAPPFSIGDLGFLVFNGLRVGQEFRDERREVSVFAGLPGPRVQIFRQKKIPFEINVDRQKARADLQIVFHAQLNWESEHRHAIKLSRIGGDQERRGGDYDGGFTIASTQILSYVLFTMISVFIRRA